MGSAPYSGSLSWMETTPPKRMEFKRVDQSLREHLYLLVGIHNFI